MLTGYIPLNDLTWNYTCEAGKDKDKQGEQGTDMVSVH